MCVGEQRDQSLLRPMLTLYSPSQIFKRAADLLGTAKAAWGKREVVITGLCLLAVDKTPSPEQLIFFSYKAEVACIFPPFGQKQ